MSSAAAPSSTPRPSVFISYASEDRTAARALRDILTATGLDVWYDENELGGGDAWDQKIRRQIRDCDYFMPMISAATEARKEGYFRREWRLAAERTLDMADDVMFLLPVSLDGTSEIGARVPDKFLSVQWLRLPGGQSTPALEALCRRLLTGGHIAPPRPPAPTRASSAGYSVPPVLPSASPSSPPRSPPAPASLPTAPAAEHPHAPPALPPFPHPPEKGGFLHGLKFFGDAVAWLITSAWILVKRAPRWVRVILSLWFIFAVFSRCSRNTEIDTDKAARAAHEKKTTLTTTQAVKDAIKAAQETAKPGSDPNPNLESTDFGKVGLELARQFTQNIDAAKARLTKQLTVVPFAPAFPDDDAGKFADQVFNAAFGRIMSAKPTSAGTSPERPAAYTDASLVAYGKKLHATFVLAARPADGDPRALKVSLIKTDDGTVPWTATYPVDSATTNDVAAKIAEATLTALPKK